MPLEVSEDRILLKHPNGSSVIILLYGATVISWESGSPGSADIVERLFLSSKANLDGNNPVRGGIPIIFPCFGAPTHPEHVKLVQHGFARREKWQWGGLVMDNGSGVSVRLTLEPTEEIRKVYNRPFQLGYVVTLAEHQLSTDLHVKNTSTSSPPIEFQALLHNYIRLPAGDVRVTPLRHLTYYDKTQANEEARSLRRVELREVVDVLQPTDSVYEDAPQNYEIKWPEGEIGLRSTNLKDVVLWNPGEGGRKIGDMEEGGWERYICVEPGFVRGFAKVEAGETWIGQQVLTLK